MQYIIDIVDIKDDIKQRIIIIKYIPIFLNTFTLVLPEIYSLLTDSVIPSINIV